MTTSSPVVFVTGGSRGMGLAIVKRFQELGYRVATCATTEASARSSGAELALACDVADRDQVREAIAQVVKKFGSLDVVVNNAGLAGTNVLDPSDDDEFWHRIIDVNLHGTYYVSKYALPHLSQGGRIINIASVLALKGVPDQTAYCAAKHGVLGLTRAMAHAVADRKITVNTICPGWTRTDMALGRFSELGMTEESLKSSVPLGRFIEPEEVAALVAYLASDSASGITGQSFTIDGGVLA
ncbi:MAG: putative ketoacyl reductase [Pseudomonadota bacterium]|jgi:NAD(P)-dependent dehydrogenase (short-subunit alcohol dehydrogenase family)